LHYVVKLVKKNDEALLSFESDLSSVIPAESVLLDTVVGDLKVLQEELTDVIKIVSKEAEALEKAGKVPKLSLAELIEQKSLVQNVGGVPQFNKVTHLTGRTSMERFSMNAQVACEQALESVESVKTKYLLVLGYFGEDENMPTGDFFGILRRFMTEWKKATLQVEKIERLQAKERKREERRAAKEAKKAKSITKAPTKSSGGIFAEITAGAAVRKSKTAKEAPPPSGISALAAEAGLKKSKQGKGPPVGGIRALAAEAALRKSKQGKEVVPPTGIAALAAKAALKKSEEAKKTASSDGIAAQAAEAALKKSTRLELNLSNHAIAPETTARKSKEGKEAVALKDAKEGKEPDLPCGIAAHVAEAALKKSTQTELNFSNNDIASEPGSETCKEAKESAAPQGGIAAHVAEVALKKSTQAELNLSNHAVAPEAVSKMSKEGKEAVVLKKSIESPQIGISAQASQGALETSLGKFFSTSHEMRSEILRQNHDDSSVAVMAEDFQKEPMDSSDANNWNEGKGISEYMGWANQAIKASDTESVRGFEAPRNIVEHNFHDDESTIATNFDDDASIATAMTSPPKNYSEGDNGYYNGEHYDNYAMASVDPYNPMTIDAIQDPYDNAVINMPLDFHQDQGGDAGLSFGGEEGYDGPGEYGSNEMMGSGFDDNGMGGFGRDAGLGGFGAGSPTLKRGFHNDVSIPHKALATGVGNVELGRPWGATSIKKAGNDDELARPWGSTNSNATGGKDNIVFRGWGDSSTTLSKEDEQKKSKNWFWK